MSKLTQEDRDKIINTGKPPANFLDAVDKLMKGDGTDLAEIMGVVDEAYAKAASKIQTIEMHDGTVMVPKGSGNPNPKRKPKAPTKVSAPQDGEFAYVLRYKEDITYHRGTDREHSVPVKGEYYPKGSGQLSTKSLFAARMYTKKPMQFEGGQYEIVQIKLEVVS